MSTLWTPGGERPIRREPDPAAATPPPGATESRTGSTGGPGEPTEAEMAEQMAQLRDQLARTPADVVVANHAYGLFELAALHLSLDPPQLDQARLAIDALGYLVEGMGGRLGGPGEELTAGLGQLRMAFVQLTAAHHAGQDGASPGEGASSEG
ncbi:MAG: hypothetical protein JO337_12330 [Acidimicrobiales bacterium]|nr:hypothetical protein [Acidimicrobiales bacterium]